ncbi:MAG TPA: pilus assembly protein PilM [Candidatus Omnitrophota bacterium]|mgnify:CR=1 FL=1|nr:pilus assembly protein PilM [Candidatus Omnitrophota bacterium]HPS37425.1 pilus assembly protein PilM [Candidatus Omnitrophota bacterium]
MQFLSLEIGRHRLKVLLLDKDGPSLVIRQEKVLTIPPTEDLKSRISETLRQFVKENKVNARKVYLTISDPRVITVKATILPAMPPKELASAIAWQAKEDGALSQENVFFNYDVVKEFSDEEGAKQEVALYSVVNRKLLSDYVRMLGRFGYEVAQVTAAPLNNAKILENYGQGSAPQAVLDLGYGDSTLSIYVKGKLIFIRTLGFSYSKVQLILNDPLFLGTKFQTPEADSEIEAAVLSIGVPLEESPVGSGEGREAKFFNLLRPLLEGLVREVRYSFTYFMTNLKDEKPVALYLTGHGTKFKNLDVFLGRELGIGVHHFLLPPTIQCKQGEGVQDPVRLSQCVSGIAGVLGGHETVNFLPYEFRTAKFEAMQRKFLALGTLAMAAILATPFFFAKIETGYYLDRLAFAKRHLQTLGTFSDLSSAAFPRYFLTREIDRGVVPAEKMLKLLGYLLPPELVLKRFDLDAAGRRLALEVTVNLPELQRAGAAEALVKRLKGSSFFGNVYAEPVSGSEFRIRGVFKND